MRAIWMAALLALGLGSGADARAGAQTNPPTERQVNGHVDNAYPRWDAWVHTAPPNLSWDAKLDVDDEDVVHAVHQFSRNDNGFVHYQLAYMRLDPMHGRSNGFTAPEIFLDLPAADLSGTSYNFDMVVSADGAVHVAWNQIGGEGRRHVFYASRGAGETGGWSSPRQVTPLGLPLPSSPYEGGRYVVDWGAPRLVLQGNSATVYSICLLNDPFDFDINDTRGRLWKGSAGGGGAWVDVETEGGQDDGPQGFSIVGDARGRYVLLYSEPYRFGATRHFYAYGEGDALGTVVEHNNTFVPVTGAADSAGNLHLIAGDRYRINMNGADQPMTGGVGIQNVVLAVDNRDQVHVAGRLNSQYTYWARLRYPDPDVVGNWQVQTPMAMLHTTTTTGVGSHLLRTTRSGGLYYLRGSCFTRIAEHGVGERDAKARVDGPPLGGADVVSGNLHLKLPLFAAAGVGPSTACTLSYNALDRSVGLLGQGWRLNYEMSVQDSWLSGGFIVLTMPDGQKIPFALSGTFYIPRVEYGTSLRLDRLDDPQAPGDVTRAEYLLTTKSGDLYRFNTGGRLYRIQQADGNLLELFYDGAGQLREIRDMLGNGGAGRSTFVHVQGKGRHARIGSITDPGGRTYRLAYDSLGRLLSVTLAGEAVWRFTYYTADVLGVGNDSSRLSSLTSPRGCTWDVEYYPDGRVRRMTDPLDVFIPETGGIDAGHVTERAVVELLYDETLPVTQPRETTVLDRRGKSWKYLVNPRLHRVTEIRDPLVLLGMPNVVAAAFTYNTNGLPLTMRDRYNRTTQYVYETTSTPTWVKDNLKELRRPSGATGAPELTAEYTYTTDSLNRLKTERVWVGGVGRTTTYNYDAVGRLTSIAYPDVTLPNGLTQTGVTKVFAYDGPRGALSRVTDEEGRWVEPQQHDTRHGLPRAILREGGQDPQRIEYDAMGNVVEQRLPIGPAGSEPPGTTRLIHDGLYRVVSATDPAGKVTRYEYDADSNLVRVVPPAGGDTTYLYSLRGFPLGGASPDGTWEQWTDAAGNLRRARDLSGNLSNRLVDDLGREKELQTPGGSATPGGGGGPSVHVTRTTYDVLFSGRFMTSVTEVGSPADRVTSTFVDGRGRPVETLGPDGLTATKTVYNELDQVVATEQWHGSTVKSATVYLRDARFRVHEVRQQNGAFAGGSTQTRSWRFILDRRGLVERAYTPLGTPAPANIAHSTGYVRDARGRVTGVTDGLGVTVRGFTYGDDDLVESVQIPDPELKTTTLVTAQQFRYTARKELKEVLDRRFVQTRYEYGALPGQVTRVVDPLLRGTRTGYDPLTQRVSEVAEAEGTLDLRLTQYGWENGLLKEVRVPSPLTGLPSVVHRRHYDRAGRLEKLEGPLVAPERYFYNDFSELSQVVAGARTTTHSYDSLGRPVATEWSGAASAVVTRTWLGSGLPESVSDGGRTVKYTWDEWRGAPLGEEFRVGGAAWKSQSYTVDPAGNLTGYIDPQAGTHGWPVDVNGRPIRKEYNGGIVADLTYTPGGLLDTETLKSSSGTTIGVTTYVYDDLGRVSSTVTTQPSTKEIVAEYAYGYDAAGQVTRADVLHLGAVFAVVPDGQGRVKSESTSGNGGGLSAPPFTNDIGSLPTGNQGADSSEVQGRPKVLAAVPSRTASYTYDAAGNRTGETLDGQSTTYEYNEAYQLISQTGPGRSVAHEYDEWGNEWRRTTTEGASTKIETYTYNHLQRLSAYTNSQSGAVWTYDFWPTGDRYSKTNIATSQSELYLHRGNDVAADYTRTSGGTPVHTASYLQGLGIDSKTLRVSSSGERRYYLSNLVGTVGAALDNAGAIVQTTVRDAWGRMFAGSQSDRYGFAQREHDTESGLVFMRHRMYDPSTGRFTQTDPLRGNRPFEHYAYGANNPVSMVDPLGLQAGPYLPPEAAKGLAEASGKILEATGKVVVAGVKYAVTRNPAAPWGIYNQITDAQDALEAGTTRAIKVYTVHRAAEHSAPAAGVLTGMQLVSDYAGPTAAFEGGSGLDLNHLLDTGDFRPTLSPEQQGGRFLLSGAQVLTTVYAASAGRQLLQMRALAAQDALLNQAASLPGDYTLSAAGSGGRLVLVAPIPRPLRERIADFNANKADWEKVAVHAEASRTYPGGISLDNSFINKKTGESLYRHELFDKRLRPGKGHPHFRPEGKANGE